MDATGTLATTEVLPEQRVANTTADAIVQPPFVWVAHKSSADSLPPSVIVVQAERALSPWALDVGEATPLAEHTAIKTRRSVRAREILIQTTLQLSVRAHTIQ